jgi:hypothetical protein
VRRGDDRYEALRRGFNQRWIATPDYVSVVRSTAEVVAALNIAEPHLRWIREFSYDVHRDTGGVPVLQPAVPAVPDPGEEPVTYGVLHQLPGHRPRRPRVEPLRPAFGNVFRHAQSIRPTNPTTEG